MIRVFVLITLVLQYVILLHQFSFCNSQAACDVCQCYNRRIGNNNKKTYYIVDCSNNGLSTFPTDFPLISTHILLDGNSFESVDSNTFGDPGRILPNIREIYLHNNNISYINPNAFANVLRAHTILLHFNSLQTIPSGLLTGMTYLKYFWINNCLLTSIPSGMFSGLSNLVEVYLYDNALTSLDLGLLKDSPRLRSLLVHGNPINSPTCCNLCGVPANAYIRWGDKPDGTELNCGCDGVTTCSNCAFSTCTNYVFSGASSFAKYSYIVASIAALSSIIILLDNLYI